MKEEMRRVERSTMQLSTDVIRDLQLFKTAYNIYFAEEIERMFDNAKEIK